MTDWWGQARPKRFRKVKNMKRRELENKLSDALNDTESAMDEMANLLKYYKSESADKIKELLAMAFDMIDDEQQIMGDIFEG